MTPRQKALRIAKVALEGKAEDLTILDLRKLSSTFDFFVLCSVSSKRRSQALADRIQETLGRSGAGKGHIEGYTDGGWVLLDYGDVIGHLFTPEQRDYYNLEHLWGDAPQIAPPALGRKARAKIAC